MPTNFACGFLFTILALTLWVGPTTFSGSWSISSGAGLAAADACFDSASLNFTSERGSFWLNGQSIKFKGLSWFGFNTHNNVVHGLWSKTLSFFFDFMTTNKFNIIRLPFYMGLVFNDGSVSSGDLGPNSDLAGKSALALMDKVIDEAANRGILVMLDLHSFDADTNTADGSWYNSAYPESKVIQGWTQILNRYKTKWNVVAADIKNEPFSTTWGTGSTSTDWNTAVARIANAIADSVSNRFLIFVEGTANSPSTSDPCFWGENLSGVKTNPVRLNHQYKLVYSPHVYGPTVSGQPYFSASNYPANMPAIWNAHFGFVPGQTGSALMLGEWGGKSNVQQDITWLHAMADYLVAQGFTDQFFWSLNPNSGDTGGLLLDDWTTPDTTKLTLLASVVPSPSKFTVSGSQVCLVGGTAAASPSPSPSPKVAASSSSATPSPSSSKAAAASPSASKAAAASPSASKAAVTSPSPSASRAPAASSPSSSPAVDQGGPLVPSAEPSAAVEPSPSEASAASAVQHHPLVAALVRVWLGGLFP